jgi:two-component system response regulator
MTDGKLPIELLMVDDNEDDLLLFREAFKASVHFRVDQVAYDGERALEILREPSEVGGVKGPSLVLLDINLPKKDGFQTLREMKEDPRLRPIPVVILTTSARQEDVEQAWDLGASAFISKPSTREGLKNLIQVLDSYWGDTVRLPRLESKRTLTR